MYLIFTFFKHQQAMNLSTVCSHNLYKSTGSYITHWLYILDQCVINVVYVCLSCLKVKNQIVCNVALCPLLNDFFFTASKSCLIILYFIFFKVEVKQIGHVGGALRTCRFKTGAPNGNFQENICSEDDLRSRIFGAFVVKFLACLPLLGFSNIYKMV